jgi:hypothetical protein
MKDSSTGYTVSLPSKTARGDERQVRGLPRACTNVNGRWRECIVYNVAVFNGVVSGEIAGLCR